MGTRPPHPDLRRPRHYPDPRVLRSHELVRFHRFGSDVPSGRTPHTHSCPSVVDPSQSYDLVVGIGVTHPIRPTPSLATTKPSLSTRGDPSPTRLRRPPCPCLPVVPLGRPEGNDTIRDPVPPKDGVSDPGPRMDTGGETVLGESEPTKDGPGPKPQRRLRSERWWRRTRHPQQSTEGGTEVIEWVECPLDGTRPLPVRGTQDELTYVELLWAGICDPVSNGSRYGCSRQSDSEGSSRSECAVSDGHRLLHRLGSVLERA